MSDDRVVQEEEKRSEEDPPPGEKQVDLHDPEAVRGRIRQLEETVVELDDTAQAFKILAEKQAAEINAKEILLARKTEYVDELLEQIKTLTSRLEAKTTEAQALEWRTQKVNAQMKELREQVKEDEEEFAMVCAALDAREQTLAKKSGELASATETEKHLRKELDRHQGAIRRLEKNVEDLHPEKADACLSPRSFQENQLIRLRDDAIEAKSREVWLLSGKNDQLRVQLDELEVALEQLQRNVLSKENDLVRRQRRIDKLEAEVDALQVSRSQAEGRERAMEIATNQNEKLLQALEAQERTAEDLKARLEDSERECERLRSSHREHIARSAESEVEVLHRTRQAEEKSSAVSALQEKLRRERKLLQDELSSSHLNYQMEIEKVQSELVLRRNKQYELTLKLQDVEARLHEAVDRRESADEQLLAAQCRMLELERVLHDSLEWKKQLEAELASRKADAAEEAEKQSKLLAGAKREITVLQKQLEELKEALARRVALEKQQELRYRETRQLLSAQEALTLEQKERIHRLVRDVNRESQARAAVELEKTLLKDQLETLRHQTESTIRECLEQKRQVQDKRQRIADKLTELRAEFHAVQSAKSKLVCKFANAFGQATRASLSNGVVWPCADCLEVRECWLVDDDLRPLLAMLDGECAGRLQRVDLRYNRLTSEGMGRFLVFLKKVAAGLATAETNAASRIREIDLRQNCVSLDGIRVVAKGLETLISSSKNASNGLKRVVVTDEGRIEVFAVGTAAENGSRSTSYGVQDTAPPTPILVVDISENVDADWLVAESRRFQAQFRRRGKEPDDPVAAGNNNRSNVGAAQLLSDDLSSSRDKSLEEIYGLDLVRAFMGQDKLEPGTSPKGAASRRKSTTTLNPARTASPRADPELNSSMDQLPAVGNHTPVSGHFARSRQLEEAISDQIAHRPARALDRLVRVAPRPESPATGGVSVEVHELLLAKLTEVVQV
ncbi:LPXTG-motif cell wall anchor domain protein [Phytophthora pseudosyringae]|uniref:LPXTG-motif cell wall anchor domain protein n=1 Tax=Phytophthora pseudosyringae TaxID=221518 RepID=A0A8T1VE26_9STRA|nr:LPXTG-motif cell wall anchor domain protein [Phytophthora pseudosyringae]